MDAHDEVERLEQDLESRFSRSQVNVLIPLESGAKLEQVLKLFTKRFGKRVYPTDVLASTVVSFIDRLYNHYFGEPTVIGEDEG